MPSPENLDRLIAKVEAYERAWKLIDPDGKLCDKREPVQESELLPSNGVSITQRSPDVALSGLSDDMEELSVDKDRYVGKGSGLHLAKTISNLADGVDIDSVTEQGSTPSLIEIMFKEKHLKESADYRLPPPDLSNKLVAAYFDVFNRDNPLLHRPSFERMIAEGHLKTNPPFRALYYLVCALGARWAVDSRLDIIYKNDAVGSRQVRGYDYFELSTKSTTPVLASATLHDIQASVLRVVWLMGSASPINAWAAIGYGVRRIVDVGAHREFRARWTASPLTDQLRKRACHQLFSLDRMISASLGRPLALHEDEIDLADPLDITDEDLDAWELHGIKPSLPACTALSGVPFMRRLQVITSRALRLLYPMNRLRSGPVDKVKDVHELDSSLNQFISSIPPHLDWNTGSVTDEFIGQSAAIYCAYYSCQIMIHREFMTRSGSSGPAPFPSLAICANAARACTRILDHLRIRNRLDGGFHWVPITGCTASLILLVNVFNNSQSTRLTSSAVRDVKSCILAMRQCGETTYIASKVADAMEQLVEQAMRRGSNESEPDRTASPASAISPLNTSMRHKRTAADAESPLESGPSSSVGASPESGEVNHDGGETRYKNSRRKAEDGSSVKLPLTTDDLSLATFVGRPTYRQRNVQRPHSNPIGGFRSSTPAEPQLLSHAIMDPDALAVMYAALNASRNQAQPSQPSQPTPQVMPISSTTLPTYNAPFTTSPLASSDTRVLPQPQQPQQYGSSTQDISSAYSFQPLYVTSPTNLDLSSTCFDYTCPTTSKNAFQSITTPSNEFTTSQPTSYDYSSSSNYNNNIGGYSSNPMTTSNLQSTESISSNWGFPTQAANAIGPQEEEEIDFEALLQGLMGSQNGFT